MAGKKKLAMLTDKLPPLKSFKTYKTKTFKMAAVDLFGWDLTYRSVENELRRKEELLVAFTHWYIIKNGFLCIGNGDSKTLKGNEAKGETLAPGWNQNEDYNIRYVYADRLYLLRASITGGDIIFNFLRADDLCISSCVFKMEDTVKQLKGDITTTIPDYKNVLSVLRKELIEPVFSRVTHSAAGTQTTEEKVKSPPVSRQDPFSPEAPDSLIDPLSVPPRRPPIPIPARDPLWTDPRRDPSAVGRSDLDPFGGHGSGGGMIFDPTGPRIGRNSFDPLAPNIPHGLPRGAVPPGARFDPFNPPGTGRGGRGAGPDPDHLPPPGYDDMFIDADPPDGPFNSFDRTERGRSRTDPDHLRSPGGPHL